MTGALRANQRGRSVNDDGSRERIFRPGWRWRSLMAMLGLGLLATALIFARFALAEPGVWGLSAVAATLGVAVLIRVPLVRLAYDDDEFLAAGVLWSRRIELDQIDDVDVAPEAAVVHWTSATGRARTTPLTAVNAGRLRWLPPRARRRRAEYLKAFDSFLRSR